MKVFIVSAILLISVRNSLLCPMDMGCMSAAPAPCMAPAPPPCMGAMPPMAMMPPPMAMLPPPMAMMPAPMAMPVPLGMSPLMMGGGCGLGLGGLGLGGGCGCDLGCEDDDCRSALKRKLLIKKLKKCSCKCVPLMNAIMNGMPISALTL